MTRVRLWTLSGENEVVDVPRAGSRDPTVASVVDAIYKKVAKERHIGGASLFGSRTEKLAFPREAAQRQRFLGIFRGCIAEGSLGDEEICAADEGEEMTLRDQEVADFTVVVKGGAFLSGVNPDVDFANWTSADTDLLLFTGELGGENRDFLPKAVAECEKQVEIPRPRREAGIIAPLLAGISGAHLTPLVDSILPGMFLAYETLVDDGVPEATLQGLMLSALSCPVWTSFTMWHPLLEQDPTATPSLVELRRKKDTMRNMGIGRFKRVANPQWAVRLALAKASKDTLQKAWTRVREVLRGDRYSGIRKNVGYGSSMGEPEWREAFRRYAPEWDESMAEEAPE